MSKRIFFIVINIQSAASWSFKSFLRYECLKDVFCTLWMYWKTLLYAYVGNPWPHSNVIKTSFTWHATHSL